MGTILTLNAGSSTLKFALFERAGDTVERQAHGAIEQIGTAPRLEAKNAAGDVVAQQRWADAGTDFHTLLSAVLEWAEAQTGAALEAAGHRVVHGGPDHAAPERVTPDLLRSLERVAPLAPLHVPHNIALIRAVLALRPRLPQAACFDTAFHRTMPPVATRLALPRELATGVLRRYGFHGLSYEYIAGALRRSAPRLAAGRVVVAHLGSGASLCALRDGRSVDTTMSFTALDGLVMATRCGSIDPGVILYLLQERNMAAAEVEDLLYHRCGLLGLSGGVSGDMRDLLEDQGAAAREAVESFVYRIAREAAAMAACLGGIDGFVFTGGIGEHAAPVRALVAERLAWLGADLDHAANASAEPIISTASSAVELRVMPTDEESVIAQHTLACLGLAAETPA